MNYRNSSAKYCPKSSTGPDIVGNSVRHMVTSDQEETVDPAQFPEVLDYKTGLHSKGKVIRNESFK